MAYYTIAAELQGADNLDGHKVGPSGIEASAMNVAAYDYVFLDSEFNAEACPGVTEEQLAKLRHEFKFWYPMDMRCSAKDLIRNHLTMSLYHHASIWSEEKKMSAWTRSYQCNGYLNLNGAKMSKSTGNFLTLRQTIDKYGVDASRITLADAGDSLDDANFSDETANAAILKLFVLEGWIKTQVENCVPEGKAGLDFALHNPADYDTWDRIFVNQMNSIIQKTERGYRGFVYRDIIKFAFNEVLNLKE